MVFGHPNISCLYLLTLEWADEVNLLESAMLVFCFFVDNQMYLYCARKDVESIEIT